MIRKFFAIVFIIAFVFLLQPLFILLALSKTLLNESYVRQKVIPESFTPLYALLAEQFSRKPTDIALFKERIGRILPPERGNALLQSIVIQTDPPELDFSLLKVKLREEGDRLTENFPACESTEDITREFRFCKPAALQGNEQFASQFTNSLTKELPEKVSFTKNPEAEKLIRSIILTQRFLPIIIGGVAIIFLGAIALIIFSPWSSVLKWTGSAIVALTLVMTLFLISLSRFSTLIPLSEVFTSGQIEFVTFLAGHVISKLKLWTFFLGGTGILLVTAGIVVQSKREL